MLLLSQNTRLCHYLTKKPVIKSGETVELVTKKINKESSSVQFFLLKTLFLFTKAQHIHRTTTEKINFIQDDDLQVTDGAQAQRTCTCKDL